MSIPGAVSLVDVSKSLLRGVAQVMLQGNAMTGALFLAGIFYNSRLMGVGTMLAVVVGTGTAHALRYNKTDIAEGLYGFNATLVGLAFLFLFEPGPLLFLVIVACASLSSVVMHFMHTRNLFPFTFPFVLSSWTFLLVMHMGGIGTPLPVTSANANFIDIVSALSKGVGEVMFQDNIVTGVIFLVGILINSRLAGLYALLGTAVGVLAALALDLSLSLINLGIFGYNGVLCGLALMGRRPQALLYALTAILLSVLIIEAMIGFGLIAFTSPFVFATWLTLACRRLINAKMISGGD